jgi:hypothetical protein
VGWHKFRLANIAALSRLLVNITSSNKGQLGSVPWKVGFIILVLFWRCKFFHQKLELVFVSASGGVEKLRYNISSLQLGSVMWQL